MSDSPQILASERLEMEIIARVKSDFPSKFGIPRQSGLVPQLRSTVIFEPKYRVDEALRGLEGYSHIWLIWQFSQAVRDGWSPTVRPPRLGGNTRVGVFATRSPFRPNHMALSAVRLDSIERTEKYGSVLHISGADIMDGTPVLDIKPYLPLADCITDARGGFSDERAGYSLNVNDGENLLEILSEDKREAAISLLTQDPRPSYQSDSKREYGVAFAGYDIRFRVDSGVLYVTAVVKL